MRQNSSIVLVSFDADNKNKLFACKLVSYNTEKKCTLLLFEDSKRLWQHYITVGVVSVVDILHNLLYARVVYNKCNILFTQCTCDVEQIVLGVYRNIAILQHIAICAQVEQMQNYLMLVAVVHGAIPTHTLTVVWVLLAIHQYFRSVVNHGATFVEHQNSNTHKIQVDVLPYHCEETWGVVRIQKV